jgi:type II secretory pathway pseudopilin PulG
MGALTTILRNAEAAGAYWFDPASAFGMGDAEAEAAGGSGRGVKSPLCREVALPYRQGGFTYIGLLLFVAMMGIGLAAVGEVWHASQQRAQEQELLHIGHEYRRAIEQYYKKTPGPVKQYPKKLQELVHDNRFPKPAHHLRKLYPDPITRQQGWGLVKGPGDVIMGVFSLSDGQTIKRANFHGIDQTFTGKTKYSEWKFVYVPSARQGRAPGLR